MRLRNRITSIVLTVCSAAALASAAEVTLAGGGSTFILPIFVKWSNEYKKRHPDVRISYDPIGSAKGIARAQAAIVDFAGSDGPMTDAQLNHANKKIAHIPVILGAVVPSYNLPDVKQDLNFTPAALAGIFLGTIKRWDDPELVRANKGVTLPPKEIGVVFRLDGSGTTYVWVDYLSKVSPQWASRVGRGTTVNFPVGFGARFNEGVAEYIKGHPYSLGYLQVTYAVQGNIQRGLVQNSSGNFVKGEPAGITAAAAATATNMPADFRTSITNAEDADAYPISSFTWLLMPVPMETSEKRDAMVGFLQWILSDGQRMAGPLHYAPLPGDVALNVRKAVNQIK